MFNLTLKMNKNLSGSMGSRKREWYRQRARLCAMPSDLEEGDRAREHHALWIEEGLERPHGEDPEEYKVTLIREGHG
jgi:hypothetical protein